MSHSGFNKGFTGYEGLSMDYKGSMVEEEYWNRMIGLWKRKNESRREQAQMRAEMMGCLLSLANLEMCHTTRKSQRSTMFNAFNLAN
eukprot:1948076-Amphidinium_carterae.1